MIVLDVEYLKYSEIKKHSTNFLIQNNVNSMPVPIENIIDMNYGIDIIPIPGLLDLYEVDGFIAGDFSCIYIDSFVYEHRYYRYRFTLAHEIAHYVIHKEYLGKYRFNDIAGWRQFVSEIDPDDHSKMEFQGYTFGGLVLVPQEQLIKYMVKYLPNVMPLIEQAQRKGVSREEYLSYAKDRLATLLSPIFEASTDVLNRRMGTDSIDALIP